MEIKIENFLKNENEITSNRKIDMDICVDENTNYKYSQISMRSVNSPSEKEKSPRSNLKSEEDIEQHEVPFYFYALFSIIFVVVTEKITFLNIVIFSLSKKR